MTKMVTAPNNTEAGNKDASLERRCENADCNVNKLVSMVPKRKTAQFVTEPNVIEKPMLVNGFTTIFQVDGSAAKISDITSRGNDNTPSTIFRIIPNTHAHIVNYVVVDTEGESLRKINSGEPTTMKKLLESQRISAEQMLSKLMSGQGSYLKVSNPAVANGNQIPTTTLASNLIKKTTGTEAAVNIRPVSVLSTSGIINNSPSNLQTIPTTNVAPISNALGALAKMPTTTTTKLPMRSVTIKKIGSGVAIPTTLPTLANLPSSATVTTTTATSTPLPTHIRFNSSIKVRPFTANKSFTSTPTSNTTTTTTMANAKKRNSTPLIKTVPLSQLQEQPMNRPKPMPLPLSVTVMKPPEASTTTPIAGASTSAATDNSIFEKMQKELEDLRRTVSLLAETQKKTLTATSTDDEANEEPQNKKMKI